MRQALNNQQNYDVAMVVGMFRKRGENEKQGLLIIIISEDKTIYCHRSVLAARSPYFHSMFAVCWRREERGKRGG